MTGNMTDRERTLATLNEIGTWDDELRDLIADAMLEFAANEVETCLGDPTFRAEELREQVGGKR